MPQLPQSTTESPKLYNTTVYVQCYKYMRSKCNIFEVVNTTQTYNFFRERAELCI